MDRKRIRALRDRLGLTQYELAREVGLKTHATISHLETGRRKPSGVLARLLLRLENDVNGRKV